MSGHIEWAFFPRNAAPPQIGIGVIECFKAVAETISSRANDNLIGPEYKEAVSDAVLRVVRPGLEKLGFTVESGKTASGKIKVPVLFERNGKTAKAFDADAYHRGAGFVLEIEAGRGVVNNQFLKDIFQASVMVDVDYLCIAVRQVYKGSPDFEKVYNFLDVLYTSGRLQLPLKGILLIGY